MALIPPDAGIRMRMQTEASLVQPLAPVKAIPADLPDLQVGQAFTARIVEALPENTFKALVAGRQLTLQLPEGAKPGDTLELVLIDRTPRTLIAQRAEAQPAASAANQAYSYAKISTTGQLIGQLLLPEGETPQPAPLNRGQPLLPKPPATAAELAPTLAKAVSQSGLFYESHQAQWLTGQWPLESLRAEPQGQLPVPAGATVTQVDKPEAGQSQPATAPAPAQMSAPADKPATTSAVTQNLTVTQSIPEEVRPLIQQQLDAVATQRLAWQGEVWPGQFMDWQIERDLAEERNAGQAAEEAPRWTTTLRLAMPRLGAIGATLQLTGGGLRLHMTTTADETAADLRRQAPELVQALADGGLTLQSLEVRREA
ncbi:MAG TPA: flagellar hook-length control protein FliK [Rhodocyclaceae bacterium]|nr:flagellar hook-length control protein FliK [Rhodocyclaceae bacterium]